MKVILNNFGIGVKPGFGMSSGCTLKSISKFVQEKYMSSITLKKIIISKVEAQLKDFQSKNLISWAGNIIKK